MNNWQTLVRATHEKFGHPAPDRFALLTREQAEFRANLILEEALESAAALTGYGYEVHSTRHWSTNPSYPDYHHGIRVAPQEPSVANAIDGLCDSIIVLLGTAVALGIDLEPFMSEVHRANMAKERSPTDVTKWIKPDGWKAPDVEGVLVTHIKDQKCVEYVRCIVTTDDWHPCFDRNKVKVSALRIMGGGFRVRAWGDDDLGVERDDFETFESARMFVDNVPSPVTIQYFLDRGFVNG